MDWSPIFEWNRTNSEGVDPEHYKKSANQIFVNGKHLKTWKKLKRNLLLKGFFLSRQCSQTHTVHSKAENMLVVASQGRGTPTGKKRSSWLNLFPDEEFPFNFYECALQIPILYSIYYHSPKPRILAKTNACTHTNRSLDFS